MEYKTSIERKAFNEKKLAEEGVKFNPYLPVIFDFKNILIRSSNDIAKRCLILSELIETAHGDSRSELIEMFKVNNLWAFVTPNEKEYLLKKSPSREETIEVSWKIEALKVLYWSLGFIKTLDKPIEYAELSDVNEIFYNDQASVLNFGEKSEHRDLEEILDEADYIYRLHQAVRSAYFNQEDMNQNYDAAIVFERHYAFNWLLCYQEDWDEITTDT